MKPIRFRHPACLLWLAVLLTGSACQVPFLLAPESHAEAEDALLALYRNDHLRPLVVDYYSRLTGDSTVALAILETCDDLDLDPSLAFALAWNESRFNPRAVNRNPSTIDRGLFQLNSRTFSGLDHRTVFDPKANAKKGLGFYKMALERLGTEEKALGYYNSGIGLLTNRPLPQRTQTYIKKILEDRDRMDRDAIASLYFSHDTHLALR